jgi:hypothetical protein
MSSASKRLSERFFELEDGLELEGVVYCPVCGSECCTLKRIARYGPSIFEYAQAHAEGRELEPREEDMGWICSGGCTKTQRHAGTKHEQARS